MITISTSSHCSVPPRNSVDGNKDLPLYARQPLVVAPQRAPRKQTRHPEMSERTTHLESGRGYGLHYWCSCIFHTHFLRSALNCWVQLQRNNYIYNTQTGSRDSHEKG